MTPPPRTLSASPTHCTPTYLSSFRFRRRRRQRVQQASHIPPAGCQAPLPLLAPLAGSLLTACPHVHRRRRCRLADTLQESLFPHEFLTVRWFLEACPGQVWAVGVGKEGHGRRRLGVGLARGPGAGAPLTGGGDFGHGCCGGEKSMVGGGGGLAKGGGWARLPGREVNDH